MDFKKLKVRGIYNIVIKIRKKLIFLVLFIFAAVALYFVSSFVYKSAFRFFYPLKYECIISKASNDYNVEKELILAIIKCESGFDTNAHSKANAHGLMQITPETFDWLKMCFTHDENLSISKLDSPEINISYGTLFISILMKKYKNEDTALSAYNAGMTTVDRWLSGKEYSKDGFKLEYIPYKETRNYVKRVKEAKNIYKKLYFKN